MANSTWKWPTPLNKTITSPFGMRIHPIRGTSEGHKGIDIDGDYGDPVVAASDGKVIDSGPARGYGKWIRIDHGNGLISIYGHMQKLIASKGQTVKAGDLIAEVGSEGNSTGAHLHFQIEKNGTPVNPLNYVSPDGDTSVGDFRKADEESIRDYQNNSTSIDASGVAAAQRVSGLSPQPIHAFVNIYIGDDLKLLATDPPKPNFLQSFEYNRLQNAGEKASFTLFDDNWDEIEQVLSENFDRVYIQYGYHDFASTIGLKSPLVRHRLLNYTISFTSTGTILSIESVTEGTFKNLKQRTMELNTYNPTEAVKAICRNLDYLVKDENFDSSQDIKADNPFNMIEQYPIEYIYKTIIPQASKDKEELFTFYTEYDSKEGKWVAFFKRKGYKPDNGTMMRTYIYQKGYDSPIIDLSFDVKGVFGGAGDFEIATEYKSSSFSTKDKKPSSQKIDKLYTNNSTTATGTYMHTDPTQSDILIDNTGYSSDQSRRRLYYRMKAKRYDGYQATMTILGDPTIKLLDYIRIINVTDSGHLHHTSGVYQVLGITDSIQGGEMMTSLRLVRNATRSIDGIDILHPKFLVK